MSTKQLPAPDAHRAPAPGWRPWVYLASGMGFSARERELVLPGLVAALEAAGANVFEPFTDNEEGAKTAAEQAPGWAYRIGQADMDAVRRCDAVFCVCNGNPPDEGAMVELGAAIALRKATFLFRDDFRTCTATEAYPLNLMLFAGLPPGEHGVGAGAGAGAGGLGWRDYYYSATEEIGDPAKAFKRWVGGEDVRPPALLGAAVGR